MSVPAELMKAHLEYLRAVRKYSAFRRAHGYCLVITCGNRAEPGKKRCARCLETIRRASRKHHWMNHTHTARYCSCGQITAECRCTGVDKKKIVLKSKCRHKTAEAAEAREAVLAALDADATDWQYADD